MVLQAVTFTSKLSYEELLAVAQERAPQFRALPGLVQKYYVQLDGENRYCGFYLWDSRESLVEFRASDLAKSIPAAYHVEGTPQIEVGEVLFPLRG